RSERQDRRHQPDERVADRVERRLRGAALRSVGPLAVEPVLPHVEIERAQVDAAEIVERVIDHVELIRVVGRAATPDEGAGLVQRPALEAGSRSYGTASRSGSKS